MYLFPVQISKRIHRPKALSPLVIPLLRLRRSHHPFTINFQCQHTQFGVPLLKYIQRRNHAYRFCRQHCATLIVLPCVRLRDLKFHNDKRRLYTDTVPLNEPRRCPVSLNGILFYEENDDDQPATLNHIRKKVD